MNEQEFDALLPLQPFGTADAMRIDTQWRRCATLAQALWGRNSEDLERQLLAPHPEIPPNFDLDDFRNLQQSAHKISAALGSPRLSSLSHSLRFSAAIIVGTQSLTTWEARCEVVRRAIEYLERH